MKTFHTSDNADYVPDSILTMTYEMDRIEMGGLAAIWISSDRPDIRARLDIRFANMTNEEMTR